MSDFVTAGHKASIRDKFKRGGRMSARTAAAKQGKILHEVDRGAKCFTDPSCPGFEFHFWRKRCAHCGCAREEHDVAWVPGMNRPMRQIEHIQEDEEAEAPAPAPEPVPKKKKRTHAEIARLAHQDPVHDHDADMCSGLTDENQLKSFNLLNQKRNEMYGQGIPAPFVPDKHPGGCCKRCDKSLTVEDSVIEVPGIEQPYCAPNCFCCKACGEELCEFNYYQYEGDVYCGRCHAEFFMPRCAGCDELIFDPTYTVAEGKKWHLVHFCCNVCDLDLCEKQYAKDSEGNPTCLPCYNDKYAVHCGTCKKPITAGERAMRAGDQSYHHDDKCFRCVTCKEGLENKKCVQYNDELYCSGCYHKEHSPPCGRCGEAVRGEFVEVRGKRYHKTCFNCFECATPFTREEKKGAYPVGEKLLCYSHALGERRAQIKAAKAKQAAEEQAAAAAAQAAEEADQAAAAAEAAEAAASASADEAAERAAAASYAAEQKVAAAAAEEAALEEAAAEMEAGKGGQSAETGGDSAPISESESGNADALGGVVVSAKSDDKGFIRQGTRKVSAMPKMSRQASERRNKRVTPSEKAAADKAVADAEQQLASGAADADSEDDEAASLAGSDSPSKTSSTSSGGGSAGGMFAGLGGESRGSVVSSSSSVDGDGLPVASRKSSLVNPIDSLWAGFSIPMKYAKFKLTIPGREILEIGEFMLIEKKNSAKCFLILATDVTFICKMVDEDCYELIGMPVQRDKSKAKLVKMPGVVAMKVKVGKWFTMKMPDEVVRSQWVGKLNAPIGFIPTKALG